MKYTIRLKVRTLILFTLVFVFLMVGSYSLLSHYAPSNRVSLASENKRLSLLLEENAYDFFNFINIADGLAIPYSRIQWQDGIEILKTYEDFKKDHDLKASYVLNVALSQYFSGHLSSAKEVIDTADPSGWTPMDLERLELIRVAIALNTPEKDIPVATKALSKIHSPLYQDVVNTLKAYMALTLGADVTYREGDYVNISLEAEDAYIGYFHSLTPIVKNLGRKDMAPAQKTLTVKVTYHGKPYKGALVYQRLNSGTSTSLIDEPAAVTDQNGYAKILIREEKDFGVGLFMPWQLIHHALWPMDSGNEKLKIDGLDYAFNFEKGIEFSELYVSNDTLKYRILDAPSSKKRQYNLRVGYSKDASPNLKDDNFYGAFPLNDLQGEIPLEKLKKEMWLPYSILHGNEGAFTLENFLEPLYLTDTYRFGIQVSDETDSYWNGCSSDALDRFIKINGADALSQGDLYLKSGDLEKAKAFYWKDESLHSLNVLEALYTHESKWDQVIKVLEKNVQLYGHSSTSKFSLSMAYGEIGDYKKQEDLIAEMMLDEPENTGLIDAMGQCLIKQGSYLEGVSTLSKINDISDYIYWNASLFLAGDQVDLLPDDLKALAKRLHKDLDASVFKLITSGSYDLAYERVLSMPSGDEQLYLKLLMEDAFMHLGTHQEDFIAYYTESLEKIKNQEYVTLLKGIKKAHHWF